MRQRDALAGRTFSKEMVERSFLLAPAVGSGERGENPTATLGNDRGQVGGVGELFSFEPLFYMAILP
jgi:hypothetical protein